MPLSMTLRDLWPGFHGHGIFEVELFADIQEFLKTETGRGK